MPRPQTRSGDEYAGFLGVVSNPPVEFRRDMVSISGITSELRFWIPAFAGMTLLGLG